MELFPDRAHVRMRSLVRGGFLRADTDGRGVSLSAHPESPNAAWLVHRVVRGDGAHRVLLHSAAYSRYLALSPNPAPLGHLGHRAVQKAYDEPQQDDIAWEAVMLEHADGAHVVRLRHASSNRFLRANGRYFWWNNGVSVDYDNNQSTMMLWKVEAIPPRAEPPVLPPLVPYHGGPRLIVYAQVDNLDAHIALNDFRWLEYNGRSVFELRTMLAVQLHVWHLSITMCVRAGDYGRAIPLIANLTTNDMAVIVIVLATGSPAAQALVYPNLDVL